MHKKDVPDAIPNPLNYLEKTHCANNAFIVYIATERLYGKLNTIALPDGNTGSNYG